MQGFEPFAQQLDALDAAGRRRALAQRAGHDFASNDYLGLADSDVVRAAVHAALEQGVPVGSGGSRLLRGNASQHDALEAFAADFYRSESALSFSSGFAANSAFFSTVPQRGDCILHDALIHASAHEGMRIGRAYTLAVPHNDVQAFADAMAAFRANNPRAGLWVAVESLYSMDGDFAPLAELDRLAQLYDAVLVIDEAHAAGVFGAGGRGLSDALPDATPRVVLRTCGKALGTEGAILCLPTVLRDFLVNRARGFIFSTAPSPLIAAVSQAMIAHVAQHEDALPGRLAPLCAYAGQTLGRYCPVGSGQSQIFPIVIGDDHRTMQVAAALQDRGFDVRGIRPPTVPAGTARLRVSITLNVDEQRISALADALAELDVHPMEQSSMSGPVIVVTGTDTDIGKTVFCAGLVSLLDADYWKPVQSGLEDETDSQKIARLSGAAADRILPEGYRLNEPASPHHAAALDGVTIDVAALAIPKCDGPLVVEGAGGALVPVTDTMLYAEIFATWAQPTVIVASTQLGTINHSLMTIEALRSRGVPIHGVAFTGPAIEHAETAICTLGGVRHLGRLPHISDLNQASLSAAFAKAFRAEDFLS